MTRSLRAFIVDDEAPARRELIYLLEQIPGVETVGEAANGTAALKGIRETRPDLVFIDIQMPGLNGLELAQFLCELPWRTLLVFATASQEHALDAFEVDAVDYLCKPFTRERVAKAVAKAGRIQAARTATPETEEPRGGNSCRRVPLYRGETIIPTSPERIIFARAEEGEVVVHTIDGRYQARCTLSDLELKLTAAGFFRSHRSYLVNGNHVREVIPWFNGSYKLIMGDKERSEIPVSRYNVHDVKRHFDL
ncbi:MAG TPA: LytTR family DNA-binding domain-containing protein [Desulfuromonadaceae bacterium]